MNIKEYLKKYQPIPYNLFYNALKNNTFFHGYLLSAPKGSNLESIARFLAKSLICNQDIYACGKCNNCQRVDSGNYGDLLVFDAKNNNIKLEDVRYKIEDLFTKTASEKRGIKVYIILNIEYLTAKASNMLLKFLEEPPKNTYAIFTSENETRILETIKSRLEIVRFARLNKEIFINRAKEENIELNDIYLLAYLYNNYDDIILNLKNEDFLLAKSLLLEYFRRLNNKESARFYVEKEILSQITTKSKAYCFYDLLVAFLTEALKRKNHQLIFFKYYEGIVDIIYKNISNLDQAIRTILQDEHQISYNLNLSLLLLHSLNGILH